MPIIVATTLHAWWSMGGVDVISVDTLLHALLLLVLKDPWADFRFVSRARIGKHDDTRDMGINADLPAVTSNGQVNEQTSPTQPNGHTKRQDPSSQTSLPLTTEQPYPPTLRARLPWTGTLLVSLRLNNWKLNLPPHDRTQPPTPAFPTRRLLPRLLRLRLPPPTQTLQTARRDVAGAGPWRESARYPRPARERQREDQQRSPADDECGCGAGVECE